MNFTIAIRKKKLTVNTQKKMRKNLNIILMKNSKSQVKRERDEKINRKEAQK